MEILLYAVGIILMAIAIAVSIALHEVGHLVPAKLFNVRVPQYMIGFGKTVFSFRRGETEYGFKAIPLGGYISMIGTDWCGVYCRADLWFWYGAGDE